MLSTHNCPDAVRVPVELSTLDATSDGKFPEPSRGDPPTLGGRNPVPGGPKLPEK